MSFSRQKFLDRWRNLDVWIRDLPLALVVALSTVFPELSDKGTQLGDIPQRPIDAMGVGVIVIQCLALVLRRQSPMTSLLCVSIGFSLTQLLGYRTAATIALPFGLISAGAHLECFRRTAGFVLSIAYVLLAVALDREGGESAAGFVTFYVILVVLWGVGSWLRLSRRAEEERRRRVAEATRAAERTAIARELHDVVTHHVTAMVVQAEAARYLTAAPDRLDQALAAITETGRRSLGDLRRLLNVLNPDHRSEPAGDLTTNSVGDLAGLVEHTRQAGQPVEFVEEGQAQQNAGSAEALAYRVVQESLTNALKYAHGSPTTVRVRYGEQDITVEVTTKDIKRRSPSPVGGSGRGLTGLRERVDILGGEFTAGQREGGFVVSARIPVGNPA